MKVRMDKNTSNVRNAAIAIIYRNKLIIPLDSEMLDSVIPYYQSGQGNYVTKLRLRIMTELSYQLE